jgi:glycosyltransferase involved in cell wall biosynthesis
MTALNGGASSASPRAMKILQTVQTLNPETGGVARAVLSLSDAMQKRGADITIVAQDDPSAPWLRDLPIPIHALGEAKTSYRYSGSLRHWLREHVAEFDCAIANGIWQYHCFALARECRKNSVPYFVFPHGMLDPWFKRTYPLKHLKKWMYWPWADYRVLRDAAAVIFTSEEERILARKSFWLYRANEVVSPLGVEAPSATGLGAKHLFLAKFPEIEKTCLLLFLGRIHPKKGCDMLIDALPRRASYDPVMLVMAGPDQVEWTAQLRDRVNRMDVSPRVIFPGMLEGLLKKGAFENADAFILPSHQENFGMAVIEALSYGVPALISDKVNIWREIEADRAGYIEPDDLAGTTRLIQRWLHTPLPERERMRANARQCFCQRFEIGHAADSLLKILRENA